MVLLSIRQVRYRKKVPRHKNSASVVGSGAFPVRLFLLNNIISEHIESAIDHNRKTKEIFIRKEKKMAYRQNDSQRRSDVVRFNLLEHIGVLSRKDNGWTREVNIVSWNDGAAKVDIREWDPDHKRMTKGVTLFEEEAETLAKVLARRYGLRLADRELSRKESERQFFNDGTPSEDAAAKEDSETSPEAAAEEQYCNAAADLVAESGPGLSAAASALA